MVVTLTVLFISPSVVSASSYSQSAVSKVEAGITFRDEESDTNNTEDESESNTENSNVDDSKNEDRTNFPNTGEKTSLFLSIIGIVIAFIGILIYFKKKKVKE